MSVAHVHGGGAATGLSPRLAAAPHGLQRPWLVGQRVDVTVQRQLSARYYLAEVAGRPLQVVQSNVALAAGVTLRATVVAAGARLELKLVDSDSQSTLLLSGSDPDSGDAADADAGLQDATAAIAAQIDSMSQRFQLNLGVQDQAVLANAMSQVGNRPAMALGGLYLAKLGVPLNPAALRALYQAQSESAKPPRALDQPLNLDALSGAVSGPAQAQLLPVIDHMDAVLNQRPPSPLGASTVALVTHPGRDADAAGEDAERGGGRQSAAGDELARELLNAPIGAGAARHFGTFPVLVSGQLLELQFVAFEQRGSAAEQNSVRRLVMTLTMPTLGRIQVAAQAQGGRLSVVFTGQSAGSTEMLAGHAPEVRELVSRLGWQVDSVVYTVGRASSAAEQAMHHALGDNTMDQLL